METTAKHRYVIPSINYICKFRFAPFMGFLYYNTQEENPGFQRILCLSREKHRTSVEHLPPGPSGWPSKNRGPGRGPGCPRFQNVFSPFLRIFILQFVGRKIGVFQRVQNIFKKRNDTFFFGSLDPHLWYQRKV